MLLQKGDGVGQLWAGWGCLGSPEWQYYQMQSQVCGLQAA